MAIDARIALGVQPAQQQPNMLAQYAQVMGIKAAQQEMESNNAMRDLFAGGANFDDPEFQRRGYMANAKGFSELLGKRATTQKTEMESLGKEIDLRRDALVNVNTPEDYLKWHETNHQGRMGNFFKSIGQTPNRESIMLELSKPGGLEKLKRESALGATRLAQEIYNTERTRISAGPGYMNANLAQKEFELRQKQQAEIDAISGGGTTTPTTSTTPMGGGGGAGSSIMVNPQRPNALIQGTTPALSPNMLRPDAQAPAAAPTTALPNDVYARIEAIDAEMAKYPINNPRSIPILQQLNQQRTQLLASAKQQYGGPLVNYETTDPTTNRPVVLQGQLNQRGRVGPVQLEPVPLRVDVSPSSSSANIDSSVVRPPPSAAVVKERQVAEKLPEAIAMNNDAIRKIDEMIGGVDANGKPLPGAKGKPHPGFNEAVGAGFGTAYIPGTQGKSFTIRHKEVLSQAFLDAFETLKGGGAITEKEGEKATAARTRMDLAQSEKEYMAAAREYQGVLKRGVENAKARIQRSGGTVPTTATPETSAAPVIKSEAEYNALPSGATYIDPDGVSRRKR